MNISTVCLIQVNSHDGPKFHGFFNSIEEAKQFVNTLPLEQVNSWSRTVNRLLYAQSGHDNYFIVELPE